MSKMKVITVTEENLDVIFGRLYKFFYNKHKTGFTCWHNFDCGFKRHINPIVEIDGEKINVMREYPTPAKMRLNNGLFTYSDYILINLTANDSELIEPGDKIAFLGNRIIIRSKWFSFSEYNYIYTVYQAEPMSDERKWSLHLSAESINAASNIDLERDMHYE